MCSVFGCDSVRVDLYSLLRAAQEVSGLHYKSSKKTDTCKGRERIFLEPHTIYILHTFSLLSPTLSHAVSLSGMPLHISYIFNIPDNNSSDSHLHVCPARLAGNIRSSH